jgi:hypothetical protein
MVIGVIAAAVLAVGAIAAVTPTVIAGEGSERVARLTPVPARGQTLPPLRRGRGDRLFRPALPPLRGFRGCLERHGLVRPDRGSPPDLHTRCAMR